MIESENDEMRSHAMEHSAMCFESRWKGGDLLLFAKLMKDLNSSSPETHFIIVQTIASAISSRSVLEDMVHLLALSSQSSYRYVRMNAVFLARRLSTLSSGLDESLRLPVDQCIEKLMQDEDPSVRNNFP